MWCGSAEDCKPKPISIHIWRDLYVRDMDLSIFGTCQCWKRMCNSIICKTIALSSPYPGVSTTHLQCKSEFFFFRYHAWNEEVCDITHFSWHDVWNALSKLYPRVSTTCLVENSEFYVSFKRDIAHLFVTWLPLGWTQHALNARVGFRLLNNMWHELFICGMTPWSERNIPSGQDTTRHMDVVVPFNVREGEEYICKCMYVYM